MGVRGFLVPTDTPGFSAKDIVHKLSMRDSVQSELHLEDRWLPRTPCSQSPRACSDRSPL